jgi:hypothetical protein
MTEYASPLDFVRFHNIEQSVPSLKAGASRDAEAVGTIETGTTVYYLDFAYVISGSYTLYSDGVTLVEDTDYEIDLDKGKITLKAGKDAEFNGEALTAEYSYCIIDITNTQIQSAIDKAEKWVDTKTNNHWTDGTQATPNYIQVTNEKHTGRGIWNRRYYTEQFPLPDVSTTLDGDVSANDETITVVSTNGFPSAGYIGIGGNKILYTGKTTTTFTGCTGVTAHSDGDDVSPHIIEISTTRSGNEPTFQAQTANKDYDLELDTGRAFLYRNDTSQLDTYYWTPPRFVPNRFRFTYIWGNSTIPDDIKELTLLVAGQQLINAQGRRILLDGRTINRLDTMNIDQARIDEIVRFHKNYRTNGNV